MAKSINWLFLASIVAGLSGCGGGSAGPITPQAIGGVYDGIIPNFDGRGDSHVGFSFDQVGLLGGAVRIVTPIGSPWKSRRYMLRAAIDSATADASGAWQIRAHADFGGDLGTFAFSGMVANRHFTYSYKDAVGSGSGIAPWVGAYVQAPVNYVGNFFLAYGAISGTTPGGGSCAPQGVNVFASPFPFVITSAQPDTLGGYSLNGYVVGGMLLGSQVNYFFYDGVKNATADVWGGNATIDAFYPPSPLSEYDISINGWNPPSTATSGQITLYDGTQACSATGPITSVNSIV